jgi:hypothetical protein
MRVRAETSKSRQTRFVDLPRTISEGRDAVKPEVTALMAWWLRVAEIAQQWQTDVCGVRRRLLSSYLAAVAGRDGDYATSLLLWR